MYVKLAATRLPFKLRPTTRECVYLVGRGHFQSRNTHHSIRYSRKPHAVRELHGCRTGVTVHAGIWNIALYCSLDQGTLTSPDDLHIRIWPYTLKTHLQSRNELSTSRSSKVIVLHADIQTCATENINTPSPLRGGKNSCHSNSPKVIEIVVLPCSAPSTAIEIWSVSMLQPAPAQTQFQTTSTRTLYASQPVQHWRPLDVSWRRNCSLEVFLISTALPTIASDRYSVLTLRRTRVLSLSLAFVRSPCSLWHYAT